MLPRLSAAEGTGRPPMEDVGTYEECDTFLELYSHCKKGNVEMVETMIDGDGVDVDLRYTVRLLRRAVGCAAAPD